MPAFFVMAAVRGRPSGLPGSCMPGPRTRAQLPPSFVSRRTVVAPHIQEICQMHTLTPFKICVTAYPEMARAILPTDDTLTTRIVPCYIPMANIRMLDRNGGSL